MKQLENYSFCILGKSKAKRIEKVWNVFVCVYVYVCHEYKLEERDYGSEKTLIKQVWRKEDIYRRTKDIPERPRNFPFIYSLLYFTGKSFLIFKNKTTKLSFHFQRIK